MQSTKPSQHIHGFDWVRAFMSVAVVMWHIRTFGKSLLLTERFARFQLNAIDVINFNLVLVAVPVFLLVSCYLLVRNASDWTRLRERVWRLILLVAFWTVLISLWKGGYGELRKMTPDSPLDLLTILLSANGEYYYFFVSLIILLLVTFGAMRLPTLWNWVAFALTTALVFVLPQIVIANKEILLVTYWNPLNFLPYPFAAVLIHRNQDRLLANARTLIIFLLSALAAAFAFAAYEWTHYVQGVFFAEGVAIPVYTRASLIFLAAGVVVLALRPWQEAPKFIRFMSAYSLALFLLHGFFRPIVLQNTPDLGIGDAWMRLMQLAAVIALSYVTALVLPLFLKDEILR